MKMENQKTFLGKEIAIWSAQKNEKTFFIEKGSMENQNTLVWDKKVVWKISENIFRLEKGIVKNQETFHEMGRKKLVNLGEHNNNKIKTGKKQN